MHKRTFQSKHAFHKLTQYAHNLSIINKPNIISSRHVDNPSNTCEMQGIESNNPIQSSLSHKAIYLRTFIISYFIMTCNLQKIIHSLTYISRNQHNHKSKLLEPSVNIKQVPCVREVSYPPSHYVGIPQEKPW